MFTFFIALLALAIGIVAGVAYTRACATVAQRKADEKAQRDAALTSSIDRIKAQRTPGQGGGWSSNSDVTGQVDTDGVIRVIRKRHADPVVSKMVGQMGEDGVLRLTRIQEMWVRHPHGQLCPSCSKQRTSQADDTMVSEYRVTNPCSCCGREPRGRS